MHLVALDCLLVLIIDAFSYSYFKYLVAKLMRSKLHTIVNV